MEYMDLNGRFHYEKELPPSFVAAAARATTGAIPIPGVSREASDPRPTPGASSYKKGEIPCR